MKSKISIKNYFNISVLGLIHGLIDATSVGLVISSLYLQQSNSQVFFIWVLTYNILAFGLQFPLGILVDKFKTEKLSMLWSFLLLIIAIIFFKQTAIVVILAGIANALFHIGGGSYSLSLSPEKASFPGIFVAPGALGLTIGILLGRATNQIWWPFIILLITSAIFVILYKPTTVENQDKQIRKKLPAYYFIFALILLVIVIRSIYGLTFQFPWKSDLTLMWILTGAIVLGKMLGGILGDKFGFLRTTVLALIISTPLLVWGQPIPALAIMGSFFFQFTMPIALTVLSNLMPNRPATAFGLNCLALLIGALLMYSSYKAFLSGQWVILTMIILSIVAIIISLYYYLIHKKQYEKIA